MLLGRILLRVKETAYVSGEHRARLGNGVGVKFVLWVPVLCWPHRREWAALRTAAGRRESSRKTES